MCLSSSGLLVCVFVLQEDLQHWRTISTNTREWEVRLCTNNALKITSTIAVQEQSSTLACKAAHAQHITIYAAASQSDVAGVGLVRACNLPSVAYVNTLQCCKCDAAGAQCCAATREGADGAPLCTTQSSAGQGQGRRSGAAQATVSHKWDGYAGVYSLYAGSSRRREA